MFIALEFPWLTSRLFLFVMGPSSCSCHLALFRIHTIKVPVCNILISHAIIITAES
jgi:hypothetical protein